MSKPRVIRRVTKVDRDGNAKRARDRKAGITVERVHNRVEKTCARGAQCIISAHAIISAGNNHAVVDTGVKRNIGRRQVPVTEDYHWSCLPERAVPLRRFFWPTWVKP